jgi:hypothetical protein
LSFAIGNAPCHAKDVELLIDRGLGLKVDFRLVVGFDDAAHNLLRGFTARLSR